MSLDDVVKNIGIISRNNGVLAGMQASGDDARELRTLLQDTGALARETSARYFTAPIRTGQAVTEPFTPPGRRTWGATTMINKNGTGYLSNRGLL